MSKCNNCKITILDDATSCPLCHQVLEDDGVEGYGMYPDVRGSQKKYRLFENIVLFISIVIAISVLTVDYFGGKIFGWSMVVILVLIYVNTLIRLAITGKSGYVFKTISMVVIAVLVFLGIDYSTGYRGWALNYILPTGIILMDIAILVIMIINFRNWQSYMMTQILMILLSIIPLVLLAVDVIDNKYMAIAAMAASLFLFLGTLIIGDKRARTELQRRFHI